MIRFEVSSEPIPASRPRFSGKHVYQPKRNVEYRAKVQAAALMAMDGREPLTGEVVAVVKLYRRYKPTARNYGDLDNFLKGIFDALNGVCYVDDRQIVRCLVEKHTDRAFPRLEISIESR